MLAMATAPKAVVATAKNYIAVMDFAVSPEGTLAQIPDVVNLPCACQGNLFRVQDRYKSIPPTIFPAKSDRNKDAEWGHSNFLLLDSRARWMGSMPEDAAI